MQSTLNPYREGDLINFGLQKRAHTSQSTAVLPAEVLCITGLSI